LKGDADKGKSKRRFGRTGKGEAVDEQGKAIEARDYLERLIGQP